MGKKNILFWPGWWYPSRIDSLSGIFIKRHAEAVSIYSNVIVLYITSDSNLKNKKIELEFSEERGIKTLIVYYGFSNRFALINKITNFIGYINAGKIGFNYLKEMKIKIDLIHCHVNPPFAQVLFLFTRFKKIPYIFSEHWSGYLKESGSYKGILRKVLTRIFVKKAKYVTTVSENLKRNMIRHKLYGKYAVVPNVVDTNLFSLSKNNSKKIRFIHVSGFSKLKNVPGIIRAVFQLSKVRNDFELYLVGDGETKKESELIAEKFGLKGRYIFFVGGVDTYGVANEMKKSDIFVLFSDYENSPCVIAESLSCGLTIISTDVGGVSELVNSENGILVVPRDEKKLFEALNIILNSLGKYDRSKIRQFAVDTFSYKVAGGKFLQIYEESVT